MVVQWVPIIGNLKSAILAKHAANHPREHGGNARFGRRVSRADRRPYGFAHRVAVRDSKDRNGPVLMFTPFEWEAFVGGVRDGEFDSP